MTQQQTNFDPRQPSANHHGTDNQGKVNAVHISVLPLPKTRYRCTNVYVIGEADAGGQNVAHVTVRDRDGLRVNPTIRLATGFNGGVHFDGYLPPGNANGQFVIANKFNPPNLGPLAIVILDGELLDSDVVGSLGLPYGRHVSYGIEFQERTTEDGGILPEEPDQPNKVEGGILEAIWSDVRAIKAKLGI